MRKRDMPLARLRDNAEAFDITPALSWLLEAKSRWDELTEGIKAINKGIAIVRSDLPIDKLRDDLLVLGALLDER